MIQNLFVPKKIGRYYLFSQRIIGFDVGKTHVNATQLHVSGINTTIEKTFNEKISPGSAADYSARASKAVAAILKRVDRYDEICTALPSSLVIFKEIKLPFISTQKIKMVINYEVEPLLPFSVNDAIIDFIITKSIKEETSSEVLVAAVQKQRIAQHLLLFENAGVQPQRITVDFFALYDLYKRIPDYANLKGGVALVDFGYSTTRVAYIHNGQLRFIRTLPKGVSHIAHAMSKTLNIELNESLENVIRFGLQTSDPKHAQLLTKALTDIWQEVQFTLQSFVAQAETNALNTILVLGGGAQIKELPGFVSKLLGVSCKHFEPMNVLHNPTIFAQNSVEAPPTQSICLGTALPSIQEPAFNLRQAEFSVADPTPMTKQLTAAGILLGLMIIPLGVHSFLQIRKLRNEAHASEREVVTVLKKHFKKIEKDETDLDDIVNQARLDVNEEEKLWFSFSGQARSSFLQYLRELTVHIDKQALGFTPHKISIGRGEGTTEDIITIDGQVRDHPALSKFEEELRKSKIFSYVEEQENPQFTNMKIVISKPIEGVS